MLEWDKHSLILFKRMSALILKLVLMSLFCSYITCKSYLYEYSKIQNNLPHFAISCSTARHFSLSQCASIASGSKSVRFFFNTIEHLCQWSCVFLLSSTFVDFHGLRTVRITVSFHFWPSELCWTFEFKTKQL